MKRSGHPKLLAQRLSEGFGQHRHPVLPALAITYQDLQPPQIQVLDPQARGLQQP